MWSKAFWKDFAERVVWTAAQAAAAEWIVLGGFDWQTAQVAGAAAALAAAKAIVATRVGSSQTASLP